MMMRIYTCILFSSLLSFGLASQLQIGKQGAANFSETNVSATVQVETAPDILPHRGSGRFS